MSKPNLYSKMSLAAKFATWLSVVLFSFFLVAAVLVNLQTNNLKQSLSKDLTTLISQNKNQLSLHELAVKVDEDVNAVLSSASLQVTGMMLMVTVGVVVVVYILFIRMVRRRLAILAKMFSDVAEGDGDLRKRIDVKYNDGIDKLGGLFNIFLEKLHHTITQVVDDGQKLANTSAHVLDISNASTEGVIQQQSQLDQVATAMNEMTATVEEVANSARAAAEAASNAETEAREGTRVVENTMSTIRTLADEVSRANEVIQRLQADSEEIGTVLDVIRAIAEQTNLLALNAAIEAARAGEQGRGFAVVADEVRTLASRTQQSTEEIQTMIERLQSGASDAVSVMDVGQQQAQSGVEQAARAGDALQKINSAVVQINQMNNQISSAASQQADVARQVDVSITDINRLSQTTAQGAQEASTESAELARLAGHLSELMAQFRV